MREMFYLVSYTSPTCKKSEDFYKAKWMDREKQSPEDTIRISIKGGQTTNMLKEIEEKEKDYRSMEPE